MEAEGRAEVQGTEKGAGHGEGGGDGAGSGRRRGGAPRTPARRAAAALGRCARPSQGQPNAFPRNLPDVPRRRQGPRQSAARGQRPRDPAPKGGCPSWGAAALDT